MKLSIDTDTEELEELRHTIAIIEDAIKRRENPEDYEEPLQEEEPEPQTPSQPTPLEQLEQPEQSPQQEEPPQQETPPEVDISPLAMSDYGQEKESRTMDNLTPPLQSESQTPETPQIDNKSAIKDIILTIRNQNQGQPIQMTEIINKANEKNIPEDEARSLVSELQKEGAI